jgi:hypothetical protein
MNDLPEQPIPQPSDVESAPIEVPNQPKKPKTKLQKISEQLEEFTGSRQKAKLIINSFIVMVVLLVLLVILAIFRLITNTIVQPEPAPITPNPTIAMPSVEPTKPSLKGSLDKLEEKVKLFNAELEGLLPPNVDNQIGL